MIDNPEINNHVSSDVKILLHEIESQPSNPNSDISSLIDEISDVIAEMKDKIEVAAVKEESKEPSPELEKEKITSNFKRLMNHKKAVKTLDIVLEEF